MNAYRESMLTIFKRYLETKKLDDRSKFFSYDIIDIVKTAKLRPLQSEYLASDFMEVINRYHEWTMRLSSWAAWNDVLNDFADDSNKSWEIRSEFLEPIVFFCLHQPSSFKDLLISYSTAAFHFGNLNRFSDYKDQLAEDDEVFRRLKKNHAEPYKYFLPRERAEKQLKDISQRWTVGFELSASIAKVNDKRYAAQSMEWRNHAAHYIPPRLSFGHTRPVKRYVQFGEKSLVLNATTIQIELDKSKKQVVYGFGDTPPLDLATVYQANFQQHCLVQEALALIHALLNEIVVISVAQKPNHVKSTCSPNQFSEAASNGEELDVGTL